MTETLTSRLPDELIERVEARVTRLDQSSDWIVEQALDAYVETEEHHLRTLAGLAAVDGGHVISHEAMKAWAASLSTDHPLPPPTR